MSIELNTVEIQGSGPGLPLVLLHAFPVDHRMWLPTAQALRSITQRILLVDLPGHGDTAVPEEIGLETSADAVRTAMTQAGIARAVIAGLSMGGYVALALAERHRDVVAGFALVDSKVEADGDEAREKRVVLAKALESEGIDAVRPALGGLLSPGASEEMVAQVTEWALEQKPAGVAWSARSMGVRPDRRSVLQSLDAPRAVIVGDADALTTVQQAQALAADCPGLQVTVISDAGHLSAVEQPEAVASALAALIKDSL